MRAGDTSRKGDSGVVCHVMCGGAWDTPGSMRGVKRRHAMCAGRQVMGVGSSDGEASLL